MMIIVLHYNPAATGVTFFYHFISVYLHRSLAVSSKFLRALFYTMGVGSLEFDHYVTIVMGESSSSSSDCGESDTKLERRASKKQRRKKRLMYSVENMKEQPVHNCNYTRRKFFKQQLLPPCLLGSQMHSRHN